MKRLICFSLFIFIASCLTSSYSQKAYKPIRSLLKEKKGKDALNYVKKLEADSAYMNDPKLYDLGKDANMIIYAIENEKLYLKKQYDTITFFQSIYGIYDYILRCENKEKMLLEKENIKPKFLVVIDALASSSIDRINKTIQITDTGIHPGSGIGNKRKEISFKTIRWQLCY